MKRAVLEAGVRIARLVEASGGRVLAVGGWVRDQVLGQDSGDLDLEVYGLPLGVLEPLLRSHFEIQSVGREFGVLKVLLPGFPRPVDVALPRREVKLGPGHRGFAVHTDPQMSPREAACRRDLTAGAIAMDLLGGQIVDPFSGVEDLRRRRLRAVDPARFPEDPLRVLRAAQYAARFRLQPDAPLLEAASRPDLGELPRERVFDEFKKFLLQGRKPSLALDFLRRCGQLRHFPEVQALVGVPQERKWHPEGDVYNHTLLALNVAARERAGEEREDLLVALGVLCHDLGKPDTTELRDGRFRSLGHDVAGEGPTRSFLARLTAEAGLADEVVALVREHLHPMLFYDSGARAAAIRRLAGRVPIQRLVRVARADHLGRTTPEALARSFPAGDWLLDRARALDVERAPLKPLLLGRHLIARGLEPGPRFRELLAAAYEAQLEGRVNTPEQALDLLGL